jgi:hypothetical protein
VDESAEHELRQLQRIDMILRTFSSGELSLERTLAGLRGLISALEETSEDWVPRFKTEWNAMEVEYAAALNHGGALPGPSAPGVKEATEQMRFMVNERRSALGPD